MSTYPISRHPTSPIRQSTVVLVSPRDTAKPCTTVIHNSKCPPTQFEGILPQMTSPSTELIALSVLSVGPYCYCTTGSHSSLGLSPICSSYFSAAVLLGSSCSSHNHVWVARLLRLTSLVITFTSYWLHFVLG